MWVISRTNFSKRSIISYILVFLIMILAITLLSYTISTKRLEEELTYTNLALLKQVNQNIDMKLHEIDREIINFIEAPEVRAFINDDYMTDIQKYENYVKLMPKMNNLIFTNSSLYSIYLYSHNSKRILTYETLRPVAEFFDNKWVEDYVALSGFNGWLATRKIIDNASINPIEKNVITLLRPFPNASSPESRRGAVIVNVDEDVFYNIIKNAKPKRLDQIFIINSEGLVLSHDDKSQLYKNLSSEKHISDILPLKGEGRRDSRINGINSSIFYIESSYTGWKYVSIIPHTQIKETFVTVRNILLIAALFMFIIADLAVILVSNWTYKPVVKFMNSISNKASHCEVDRHRTGGYESFEELEDVFSDIISDREKIRKQIQESLPAIKWRLVMDILMAYRTDYSELSSHLSFINVKINNENYIVMIAELDDRLRLLQKLPSTGLRLYTSNLCTLAEEFTNAENMGTAIELNDGSVAVIMSFKTEDPKVNLSIALSIASQVKHSFQEYFGATVTIGIGSPMRELTEVSKSFQEAKEALKYKVITGGNSVIPMWDISTHDESELYRVFSTLNAIAASIKGANQTEVQKQISRMFVQIKSRSFSPDMIRKLSVQIIIQGVNAVMDTGLHLNEILDGSEYRVYEALDLCETVDEIQDYIKNLFGKFVDKIVDRRSNKNNSELINRMLEYINTNYMDSNLSLNMLAETLHLSVPHLSKTFKEATETNFMDYIISIRMKKAQELLSDSVVKINEIAERVGYNNAHSFIRIFKKYSGKTPGEYRSQDTKDSTLLED